MNGHQQIRSDAETVEQVDRSGVTIIDISHDTDLAVDPAAHSILFVASLRGHASLCQGDQILDLDAERAAVINRAGARLRCRAGGKVLLVTVARPRLQALMSARHGGARSLSRAIHEIPVLTAGCLAALLTDIQARRALDVALEQALLSELGSQLVRVHGVDGAFPRSRSITLARALLDDGTASEWDAGTLAGRAGVTAVTLQRGFRDCLGMTVAAYMQSVRLNTARERLMCGWESRSMAQIAQQANFRTVIAFTRAYQRRFGETPTQTRVHAVRCNNGAHVDDQ